MPPKNSAHLDLAARIISAYVTRNPVPIRELASLIAKVCAALDEAAAREEEGRELRPAVLISKSITPDYLISLEDGKRYRSLKRHLWTAYKMTPEQYRTKWGLPPDYPMVAPSYAKVRSELAKLIGLGQQRRGARKRPHKGG